MSEPQTRVYSAGWDGPVRLLNIAPPGGGKTSCLLTFPDLFVFDFDRALRKGVPKHLKDRHNRLVFIEPENWQDVRIWTMKLLMGEKFKSATGEDFVPRAIGVDTIGGAHDLCTRSVRSLNIAQIMGKDKKPLMVNEGLIEQAEFRQVMSLPDYGLTKSRILDWVRELCKFNGHLVINCHEKLMDAEGGSVKGAYGGPAIQTGIAAEIGGFFDVYARISRLGANPPEMQILPDDLFKLKDRTGSLENRMVPDYLEMAKKLYPTGSKWV